jgi:hypothetical protein
MSKFCIRTKGDERNCNYWWAGSGWWTRRRDQAMEFDSRVAAEREREVAVEITEMLHSGETEMEVTHASP